MYIRVEYPYLRSEARGKKQGFPGLYTVQRCLGDLPSTTL